MSSLQGNVPVVGGEDCGLDAADQSFLWRLYVTHTPSVLAILFNGAVNKDVPCALAQNEISVAHAYCKS